MGTQDKGAVTVRLLPQAPMNAFLRERYGIMDQLAMIADLHDGVMPDLPDSPARSALPRGATGHERDPGAAERESARMRDKLR